MLLWPDDLCDNDHLIYVCSGQLSDMIICILDGNDLVYTHHVCCDFVHKRVRNGNDLVYTHCVCRHLYVPLHAGMIWCILRGWPPMGMIWCILIGGKG